MATNLAQIEKGFINTFTKVQPKTRILLPLQLPKEPLRPLPSVMCNHDLVGSAWVTTMKRFKRKTEL